MVQYVLTSHVGPIGISESGVTNNMNCYFVIILITIRVLIGACYFNSCFSLVRWVLY